MIQSEELKNSDLQKKIEFCEDYMNVQLPQDAFQIYTILIMRWEPVEADSAKLRLNMSIQDVENLFASFLAWTNVYGLNEAQKYVFGLSEPFEEHWVEWSIREAWERTYASGPHFSEQSHQKPIQMRQFLVL